MEGLGTAAVLAVFMVPMISLVKRPSWNPKVTYLVGLVAAFICATVGAVVDGQVKSWGEFLAYAGTALATSQTIYSLYFESSGFETKLREI